MAWPGLESVKKETEAGIVRHYFKVGSSISSHHLQLNIVEENIEYVTGATLTQGGKQHKQKQTQIQIMTQGQNYELR